MGEKHVQNMQGFTFRRFDVVLLALKKYFVKKRTASYTIQTILVDTRSRTNNNVKIFMKFVFYLRFNLCNIF
jgi:hypothetical protein